MAKRAAFFASACRDKAFALEPARRRIACPFQQWRKNHYSYPEKSILNVAALLSAKRHVHFSRNQRVPSLVPSYYQAETTVAPRLCGKTIGQVVDETVEKFPDKEAFIFCNDGIRRTFAEFHKEMDQLAAGLLALGIQRGDRVGIWAPNILEWVLTQYATARIGAILVNVNPAYRPRELEYALKKVGVKALVADQSFKSQRYYDILLEICPELETCKPGQLHSNRLPELNSIIMIGDGTFDGAFMFDDVMKMGDGRHFSMIDECKRTLQFDDPINIQFTSGTTGSPKGATLTHHGIINNVYCVGLRMGNHLKDHRICVPIPLYHVFSMLCAGVCAMVHGSTCVFPGEGFEAEATLKAIQEERCTSVYGTPTMFIDMLNHPRFSEYDVTSLSTGSMGGAPCPIDVMHQLVENMNMKDITVAYGLTETSGCITQSQVGDPLERRVSTVGQPMPHIEVKVIDRVTGEIVPRNTPGELCTRGYTTMIGYWDDEEKTRETIDETRWFHTGDLATLDDNGYISIVGRLKDVIIRGGVNIYPTEIEQFLYTNPQIEDVQVIGVPDARMGEEVCAWIKLKTDHTATEDEIRHFCRDKITYYKIPRYIRFVDSFPTTVNGKIQKFRMREAMNDEGGILQESRRK